MKTMFERNVEDMNLKIDWERKLTSRKFWTALCGFTAALLTAFHVPAGTAAQVTSIIMAGASLIAYILSEGLADAAASSAQNGATNVPDPLPGAEQK
ncbi:MAG TPA: hypothetical protein VHR42_03640 [Clostridia bacterium]|nr:hypothetical protein [Clostridia bacterium]